MYTLTSAITFVGRELANEVVIADAEVSRRHARIFWREGGFYIEDLHSTNGSYVNGRRVIEKTRLASGDILDFGETVRVIFEHDIASAVAPDNERQPLTSSLDSNAVDDESEIETLPPFSGDRATARPMRPTVLHKPADREEPPVFSPLTANASDIATDLTPPRPSVSKSWFVFMGIAFFVAVLLSCLALFYYLNTNYPNLFF